jgi:hypothetical protein
MTIRMRSGIPTRKQCRCATCRPVRRADGSPAGGPIEEMALPGTPLGATPPWIAAVAAADGQCQCTLTRKGHDHGAYGGRCPATIHRVPAGERLYLAPDGRVYCGSCFDTITRANEKTARELADKRAEPEGSLF